MNGSFDDFGGLLDPRQWAGGNAAANPQTPWEPNGGLLSQLGSSANALARNPLFMTGLNIMTAPRGGGMAALTNGFQTAALPQRQPVSGTPMDLLSFLGGQR